MILLAVFLGGLLGGVGITGYWLGNRWRQQIAQARVELKEISEQYQSNKEEGQRLRQQVADLEWQLNDARKTVRYLESRYQNNSND